MNNEKDAGESRPADCQPRRGVQKGTKLPRKGRLKFVTATESGTKQVSRYEPSAKDRADVEKLSSYGVPQRTIANVLGIGINTLRSHFSQELNTALAMKNMKMAESLYAMGTKHGSVAAAIFWLKCRAGWKEGMTPEAEPVPVFDYSKLSRDELKDLGRLMDKAKIVHDPEDQPRAG